MSILEHHDTRPQEKQGHMIVVCGAKGGLGKTMLAINLALSLYKKGRQVALWDGDFQFGDVDISLNLQPAFNMKDVIEGIETLDTFSFQSLLTKHDSGVNVLPSPDRPEFADLITPSILLKTLDYLVSQHDYLVVDTGAGLNEQSLSLIEHATTILLVTTSGLAPIKHTKSMLEIFRTLDLEERVKVIINRSTMESMAPIEKILETLQIETAFSIPNNFMEVHHSLDIGLPLVTSRSKSDVAKAIFKMAETLDSNRPLEKLTSEKSPYFKSTRFFKSKKKVGRI
jgi:pilus assembly protein CpaE